MVMAKKKVFVVSHSHWDREWYLPFEKHHLRLVKLIDDVLDLIDRDPEFNSFQLDGQAIILDDYLAVRPEQKERVKNAVKRGKLRVGPFYVLQDDFLISPEAHVKDFQIGRQTAESFGKMMNLGYFPDTFGNMGQTPQMLRLADLDAVAFGRGVKPTGLNNQVSDSAFNSTFSELNWQGPDHSQVLGILFANWYSNGNEIPVDPKLARPFWQQKLADAEKYAATDNLLLMNGVDHQPVQQDVTAALATARKLFPDYEFIHSNLDDYLAAVKADLPEKLSAVHGELTSQETDGWYTLTNTASSRIYLKQANTRVQQELINEATQLSAIALPKDQYPHDQLTYAWKLLLQNHAHDSITGCSVDEVHREMMSRFEKVEAAAQVVRDRAKKALVDQIDTSAFPKNSHPFVIMNTTDVAKTGVVKTEVELARAPFSEGHPDQQFAKMQLAAQKKQPFKIIDAQGKVQSGRISGFTTHFGADFPKDRFRQPYMAVYAQVEVALQALAPFSWQSLALMPQAEPKSYLQQTRTGLVQPGHVLENENLRAEVSAADGTITLTDKQTQRTYQRQLVFEDTGDIGNEYIYREAVDHQRIYSSDHAPEIHVQENTPWRGQLELVTTMMIPQAASDHLAYEQKAVIDVTKRQSGRSHTLIPLKLHTLITLDKGATHLDFKVKYKNKAKDHRLRVLFTTGIHNHDHEAESIFEVARRDNLPAKTWLNPSHPQRQQAFVNLHDQNGGLTIANFGLNEYEILPETGTIALTLLRSIGELGDWGYFLTPEAQCQGEQTAAFAIFCHGASEKSRYQSFRHARAWQQPLMSQQTAVHAGKRPAQAAWLQIDDPEQVFAVTDVERNDQQNLVVRGYNMADHEASVTVKTTASAAKPTLVNFLNETLSKRADQALTGAEIRSYQFSN